MNGELGASTCKDFLLVRQVSVHLEFAEWAIHFTQVGANPPAAARGFPWEREGGWALARPVIGSYPLHPLHPCLIAFQKGELTRMKGMKGIKKIGPVAVGDWINELGRKKRGKA